VLSSPTHGVRIIREEAEPKAELIRAFQTTTPAEHPQHPPAHLRRLEEQASHRDAELTTEGPTFRTCCPNRPGCARDGAEMPRHSKASYGRKPRAATGVPNSPTRLLPWSCAGAMIDASRSPLICSEKGWIRRQQGHMEDLSEGPLQGRRPRQVRAARPDHDKLLVFATTAASIPSAATSCRATRQWRAAAPDDRPRRGIDVGRPAGAPPGGACWWPVKSARLRVERDGVVRPDRPASRSLISRTARRRRCVRRSAMAPIRLPSSGPTASPDLRVGRGAGHDRGAASSCNVTARWLLPTPSRSSSPTADLAGRNRTRTEPISPLARQARQAGRLPPGGFPRSNRLQGPVA